MTKEQPPTAAKPPAGAEDDYPFSLRGLLGRLKETPAQSLLDRVDELRSRIVKSTVVGMLFFIGCFTASKPVFDILKAPLVSALPAGSMGLNFTGPMDVFLCYVRVAFLLAALFAGPFALYQSYKFLAPALPPDQRKVAIPYFIWSITLFLGGISFCHFIILPMTLEFLLELGSQVAMPVIMITDYISLVVFMMLGFGAVFQMPIVLLITEAIGLVSLEQLTKRRGFVVVAILVIAALVTPTPDPFSQLAMAIPMYLMYETAIVLIRLKHRKAARSVAS